MTIHRFWLKSCPVQIVETWVKCILFQCCNQIKKASVILQNKRTSQWILSQPSLFFSHWCGIPPVWLVLYVFVDTGWLVLFAFVVFPIKIKLSFWVLSEADHNKLQCWVGNNAVNVCSSLWVNVPTFWTHEKFWFENWEWKDFTAMVIDDGYSSGICSVAYKFLGGKVLNMN